ncbi:MAG: hypothetical protein JXB00_08195 [Bacteroidales bacterium]|nr:hypothetical protein [Bacteroidales bacterium]
MKKLKPFAHLFYISLITLLVLSSCSVIKPRNPHMHKNTGNPMEPSRQISRVYPEKRDTNRYLNNNKKKKQKWTKIRQVPGFDCPWDKSYYSTSEKKIQKKLNKSKAKLKKAMKKNR